MSAGFLSHTLIVGLVVFSGPTLHTLSFSLCGLSKLVMWLLFSLYQLEMSPRHRLIHFQMSRWALISKRGQKSAKHQFYNSYSFNYVRAMCHVNVLWLLYVVISVICGTEMWDDILPLASATFFMWRLRSNFGWTTTLTTGAHSSLGID